MCTYAREACAARRARQVMDWHKCPPECLKPLGASLLRALVPSDKGAQMDGDALLLTGACARNTED